MPSNGPPLIQLFTALFTEQYDLRFRGGPLPFEKWNKKRLHRYVGLPLYPLPPAIQSYIDGQNAFTLLEFDAIEKAVEDHFQLPDGYSAAFCCLSPIPREVTFVRWSTEDKALARESLA